MSPMERRIRESFARQDYMATIGAELTSVAPGAVEIRNLGMTLVAIT